MTTTNRSDNAALAQQIFDLADEEGTIQAADIVRAGWFRADPTRHTTSRMQDVADALGCREELDRLCS